MSVTPEEISKVKQYMMQQNRPYSVNDLFMNLHKKIGKTALQKCLDTLVIDGDIKEKTYGKQKVYVINQSLFPTITDEKLKALQQEVNGMSDDLKMKTNEINRKESELKSLLSSITTEEAVQLLQQVTEENSKLEEKLNNFQENVVLVTDEERKAANDKRHELILAWRKRRRMAVNILDSILEGYPRSRKELYEEIGVETDEEAGVRIPE